MILDLIQWFGITLFGIMLFFISSFIVICIYRCFKWLSGKLPLPQVDTNKEIKTGRLIISLFLTILILSNIAIALIHIVVDKGRIDWRIIGITLILSAALLIVFIFIVAKGETLNKAKEGIDFSTETVKKIISDSSNPIKTGIINGGNLILSSEPPVFNNNTPVNISSGSLPIR